MQDIADRIRFGPFNAEMQKTQIPSLSPLYSSTNNMYQAPDHWSGATHSRFRVAGGASIDTFTRRRGDFLQPDRK